MVTRKNYRRDMRSARRKAEQEANFIALTINRLLRNSIVDENGCWLWQRRTNTDGYGQTEFKINGVWKQVSVHRLSAHLHLELPLDSELHVLHRVECRSKACWNPDHLYVGNQSDNSKDAVITRTHNMSSRTTCDKGHPLDGLRLSFRDGYVRYCKECSRQSSKLQRKIKNA